MRSRVKPSIKTLACPLLLALLALVVYGRGLDAPFIFDDHHAILDNASIRTLSPISVPLHAPPQATTAGRPLVNLSLALNYAAHGYQVRGYHVVNLGLHIACAGLLFGIVRRALMRPGVDASLASRATSVALAASALWVAHPLATEAVQYVIQRTELMMALFYLLTLYAAARAFDPPGRRWQVIAVAACFAGMACKEVMVSAPLAVLLLDRAVGGGSFVQALRQRRWMYAGLAASWGLLLALNLDTPRSDTAGLALGVSPWESLMTQAGVLVRYLRLCFWPAPLSICYGWPIVRSLDIGVILCGLIVFALLAGVGYALFRRPAVGAMGAAFFLVLAPTSSVIAIITEVAAERRMYLPLAAVTTLVAVGIARRRRDASEGGAPARTAVCAVVVVALALAAHARVAQYKSELSIWADAAAKFPRSEKAQINLGFSLERTGQVLSALERYDAALAINPDSVEAFMHRGTALLAAGRVEQAVEAFRQALMRYPDEPGTLYNLGNALARLGRFPQAADAYRRALQLQPSNLNAAMNLGNALLMQERFDEAIDAFSAALALAPAGPARQRLEQNLAVARQQAALRRQAPTPATRPSP